MKEETIKIKADTSQADKSVKGLTNEVKNLNNETEKSKGNLEGVSTAADQATGGMISKFKGLTGVLKSVSGGFKTVKLAIASTGIGLLVIAVTSLIAAFKSSEEGQNKFAKLTAVIGAVTGNLVTLMAKLGNTIISVFTEPGKALEKFSENVEKYVINQFNLVLDGLGLLGSAIKKAFSGDFSGALEDASSGMKKLLVDTNPVVQGINALAKATKDFAKEQIEEGKIAARIADQRAKADKQERELLVARAEANRQRAELLEKAVNKEKYTTEQRSGFLQEAARIEQEITDKEIENAQLRLDAKIAENALADSTKEDLQEEAQLRANLINLETARLSKQKEVTSQILAINAEAAAKTKAEADKAAADQKVIDDAELARKASIQALEDEQIKQRQDAEAQTELAKIELEKQRAIQKLDLLNATEEERANIIASYDEKINNQKDKDRDAELLAEENLKKQKLSVVGDTFGAIAGILGENSKAGKAAAIAQATINTYQGITEVLTNKTTLPEPFGTIQKIASAGTVLASGLKAVRSITSQKLPAISGGRGGGGISSAAAPNLQAPNFNIVGKGVTNQLAESIGQKQNAPVKAYVVSSDVSSAQSMERNIVSGASI